MVISVTIGMATSLFLQMTFHFADKGGIKLGSKAVQNLQSSFISATFFCKKLRTLG